MPSARLVERCRRRILQYFHAPEDEYTVVFTANASHALRLVGESYAFEPGGRFLLTCDNHNSVNGIREFARGLGARTLYVPIGPPDLRVDDHILGESLENGASSRRGLFAYPARSNFSGVQHPLEWVTMAGVRGWRVLLDAACFVPTNRLDVPRVGADFVALSFYKMFGYPTGVGALIARREALRSLRRPWFAGGTVDVASARGDLERCFARLEGRTASGGLRRCLGLSAAGAVRVSLGLVSNFADVWAFREYARTMLNP